MYQQRTTQHVLISTRIHSGIFQEFSNTVRYGIFHNFAYIAKNDRSFMNILFIDVGIVGIFSDKEVSIKFWKSSGRSPWRGLRSASVFVS